MPERVAELLLTEAAIDKLGARNISVDEVHQLPHNVAVAAHNPRSNPPGRRLLLIGHTNGGRALTLAIERTADPTTWLVVTGWDATPRERRLLRS